MELGAPLLSVFSLHGFVCGLSETFQESCPQLHSGKLGKQYGRPAQIDVAVMACFIFYIIFRLILPTLM